MSHVIAQIVLSVWMSKSHKIVIFLFLMTFGDLFSHQLLYSNTSGCTDLVYNADLDILWVLARYS